MLQSTTSRGRSLENRLDKQAESQEIFKPGTNFSIEKDTTSLPNSQISTDNESEMKKPSVSEKAEYPKSERNGIKHKPTNSWKNNEVVQNGVTKETNGNKTQPVRSDSLDIKHVEKSDSPISPSTPNYSSEISSQSESPSIIQDDTKSKNLITMSEDEVPIVENTENNRVRKRRRWDVRVENGNEENGSIPRAEVQNDLKIVEQDFAQLRDQLYREQIEELEKDIKMINEGTHPELIARMEEIEQKRRRRLEIAESRKKYQVIHCHKQYEEAEYKAQCEFMSDKYESRRKKLDDMESKRWQLIKEKNCLDILGRIAVAALSSSSSPKINTITGPFLDGDNNTFLEETDSDIYAAGDRFLYHGQWFAKGDHVLISDSTSGRYTAKFVAATDSEVVIQRPDGSKTRLQMNLLKERKYQIHLKES
ncbi:2747_t:CDS:2 [Funneliformis mosseae]|uniref:2747_t:CDS:1 n=1 Tax=Funneliformis mosseae TaxID=27381 RepID=A0A9N8Z199_FUNMO|nr:2747_t:CDS:2 [Funneliformis mosseae]